MNQPGIYEQVRYLTGLSQEAINVHAYEVGQAFIEYMEQGDQVMIAKLERSEVFWKWWKEQFQKLCNEFIHRDAWEMSAIYTKHDIERRFKHHTATKMVSQWGRRSYCYLVEDILQPTFKKKEIRESLERSRAAFDSQLTPVVK